MPALMEAPYTENQRKRPAEARTVAQMEALEKLVALLEGRTAQTAPDPILRHTVKPNPLSQLARLKSAHASYTLGTSEMERVNDGSYLNRQLIRD